MEQAMATPSRLKSLQDVIDAQPDLVAYMYNQPAGAHARMRPGASPVPAEWSNWRDEQQAWRTSAVLFDQSHHMPELFLSGRDALTLLKKVGINSFEGFAPGRAKQFVGCNSEGQVIGDCVLHNHGDDRFELISGMPLLDWVEYQAEAGGYQVKLVRDHDTPTNPTGRRTNFRFGMDGPNAGKIFAKAIEGPAPEIKFFHTARVRIAGCEVLALRHGMAGHQGVELSGDYEHGPAVREALLKAGEEYGLKPGGALAYFSASVESGWIAYPLPAIYTSSCTRGFRQWLAADSWEARMQLGGSFYPSRLEDYYNNPFELGYGRLVKFDHDFIGREALEAMASRENRVKVTLAWNREDVSKVFDSWLGEGLPYKAMNLPNIDYAYPHRDQVLNENGECVGLSRGGAYTANERSVLSLAMVAPSYAQPGTQVSVLWGEPNGGSAKPRVERHRQLRVRATVGPVPYAAPARTMKTANI
jgi:vanillate/3-O-methylgallate O-demethylase